MENIYKEKLKASGLTYVELSKKADVQVSLISVLMNRKKHFPTIRTLLRVNKVLGITDKEAGNHFRELLKHYNIK